MLKSASIILCAVVVVLSETTISEPPFCYEYKFHYCFDFWGLEFFGKNPASNYCRENARANVTYDESITKFYIDETNVGKIISRISQMQGRILMEHLYRLESQLSIESICSFKIRFRTQDIFKNPTLSRFFQKDLFFQNEF